MRGHGVALRGLSIYLSPALICSGLRALYKFR